MKYAKISSSEASEMIPELMCQDVVDRNVKIRKSEGFRYVPILPDSEEVVQTRGFELLECGTFSRGRKSPQERILGSLSDLPKEVLDELPMRWEYVGDIVIIRSDVPEMYHEMIGKVYAEELDAKTVCIDSSGVSGEFRKPSMKVIFGSDTLSTRLENGIRYRFDVTKVMFASGNTDERERMKRLDCSGETVVDMFAGIGYFTLPIAKFTGASKIIACEKNPDSYEFLVKNVEINSVTDTVQPMLGDNRDIPGTNFADRILMGYVQKTSEFLDKALEMVKEGGIIHYHDTFYVNEYKQKINEIFSSKPIEYEILGIKEVKSFAPSVSHYVADVKIKQIRRSPKQ